MHPIDNLSPPVSASGSEAVVIQPAPAQSFPDSAFAQVNAIDNNIPGPARRWLGPWNPKVLMGLSVGLGLLGSPFATLWVGIMTAWNWWLLGDARKIYRPIAIALSAAVSIWIAVFTGLVLTSGVFVIFAISVGSALAILWFDLQPQLEIVRQRAAAGHQLGLLWLPCGISAIFVVILLGQVMFGSADMGPAEIDLGIAAMDKGDYREAVFQFGSAIRDLPQDARPFVGRGLAYEKQGKTQEALADYTEAIRLKPDFAEAYYQRGLLYRARGNTAASEADLSRASQLRPPTTNP
jgi:tetratricopeptide (TPR) repeat protein